MSRAIINSSLAFLVLVLVAGLFVSGCSRQTREAMTKDINNTATGVDRAFT